MSVQDVTPLNLDEKKLLFETRERYTCEFRAALTKHLLHLVFLHKRQNNLDRTVKLAPEVFKRLTCQAKAHVTKALRLKLAKKLALENKQRAEKKQSALKMPKPIRSDPAILSYASVLTRGSKALENKKLKQENSVHITNNQGLLVKNEELNRQCTELNELYTAAIAQIQSLQAQVNELQGLVKPKIATVDTTTQTNVEQTTPAETSQPIEPVAQTTLKQIKKKHRPVLEILFSETAHSFTNITHELLYKQFRSALQSDLDCSTFEEFQSLSNLGEMHLLTLRTLISLFK